MYQNIEVTKKCLTHNIGSIKKVRKYHDTFTTPIFFQNVKIYCMTFFFLILIYKIISFTCNLINKS